MAAPRPGRNEIRPEFKIYTGNDLAIDIVMYGGWIICLAFPLSAGKRS